MARYFDIKPFPEATRPAFSRPLPSPKLTPVPPIRAFTAPPVLKASFSLRFKLLSSLSVVVGLSLLAVGLFSKPPVNAPASAAPSFNQSQPIILPTAPAKPGTVAPWRLSIPSLGIDAAIQKVGKTKEGNMAVATNNTDVAWYNQGPMPGQPGNAVLAGHLNGGPNIPAVFEKLDRLKSGDIIYIKDTDKQSELRFKVTGSQAYDVDNAPLDKIFGSAAGAQLNLITCNGSWDKTRQEYTKRLVVFSELVP